MAGSSRRTKRDAQGKWLLGQRERERERVAGRTKRDGQGKWLHVSELCVYFFRKNNCCIFLEKTTVKKNLKTTTGGAGGVGADV